MEPFNLQHTVFFFQTMDFPTFSSYQSKKDIDIAIKNECFNRSTPAFRYKVIHGWV